MNDCGRQATVGWFDNVRLRAGFAKFRVCQGASSDAACATGSGVFTALATSLEAVLLQLLGTLFTQRVWL